ncbi:NAD(P)H-quinone oxidoreductase [Pantoea sp. 1.19]|uniref:NAD(P)H-quinone oxidoreductase n=1 Tax=Pantoea sp. 1.19 TaxID=1925589 RepID=UPI0009488DE1|nr:NAD(P)H-quinone oxidoreductase [Pantoea sp. 1.19]
MSSADALPETMKVMAITAPGAPEVLTLEERPVPQPGAGELLVRIAAAGVNRPDVMQRQGSYPPPPGASDLPGLEFAGEVVAIGAEVKHYRPGDSVCALVAGGAYAEYAVVHESNALPVPAGLSLVEAAALPENFFTVWVNLFQRAKLAAGETVLIHGGTSGIGSVSTMLARAFGARPLVTVGSADKCRAALRFGADAAINYREQDFVAEVKRLTDDRGADVIVDLIAGDYAARNMQAAAVEGRIVQIGVQGGVINQLNIMPLMMKRLTWSGTTLRARSVADKAAIARDLLAQVWPLLSSGQIKPHIFNTFPLAEAARAHRLMESSEHIGKIMLVNS